MKHMVMRNFCLMARCGVLQLAILLSLAGTLAEAATYTNNIQSDAFSPASRTIGVGDTVVWKNLDAAVPHSTTGEPTNSPAEAMCGSGTFTGPTGFCSHTFNNAGHFGYFCVVHSFMFGTIIVTNNSVPNNPPSVTLTNLSGGTNFAAPASIPLEASASDSDGSVTNVQFFSGTNSLGSLTVAPYNFVVGNVAAGNYSFTAVARDNVGAAATSAPVNVFVLTNATVTAPVWTEGGPFQLKIVGIAGQTYTLEASSNLLNWSAVITNVAPSNTFDVTDPGATNAETRFYRARQDL
jgi:plastocyanin